ncbi:hypothetical protein Sste5346_005720 [Sporothrix stenoceras]|uniref:Ubiquitin-like protease family profile domain-containing protein n=1 Tax=Sporothrix stenoceras TaxID=5173 RepID=A0ABR3Z2A3_9PEZI
MKSLGSFSPINRLTGSAKRPDDAQSSPSQHMQAPPPKRRRIDEQHDDDAAIVQSVQVDRGHLHHEQQHLRKQPSEASIDILIQPSSPDLYDYDRSRSRSASVLSGSQHGGSSRNNSLINQDEMRKAERSANGTPHHRRRRKRKGGSVFSSEGGSTGGIGRPMNLQSPSPDPESPFVIEDDASPVKTAFVHGHSKPNTNLSIDLSSSNGSNAKGRFRDRMSNGNSSTREAMGPPQRKNGLYTTKHANESVDELSEEYFPEPSVKRQQVSRNPVIHLGDPPARAAGAAAEKRRQQQLLEKMEREREQKKLQSPKTADNNSLVSVEIPMMVQAIIDSPLHVKVAFRQPGAFFKTDQDADVPLFSLTIKPPFIEELVAVDAARARSEKLHWLKLDLFHVRDVSFNVDSPIAFVTLPQGEGLGALMGLEFESADEVRRFASWASSSLLSQSIRVDQKSSPEQLKRKFDRCLAEVQNFKGAKEANDQKDKEAKESTPAKVGSEKGSARSSPVVTSNDYAPLRRTRSSRNLNGATETIDLDGNDTKSSSLVGSSPTNASSDAVASDRVSRLRNRKGRLPSSRPLLQDMEFERWTLKNPDWAREWRVPLTYSRTTVDKDDVARLDEGEFLNDNIINFYIQYLQASLTSTASPDSPDSPDLPARPRIYFHNTFFYEKLRPSRGREIAFDGVKRWTAKVDLFDYDYIIVPVNEHAHWWVAIICNVPKILDKALPESMKEKKEVVEEETEVVEELEAVETKSDKSKSPEKSSMLVDDDDVKETGVYRFVPIDVDGPKPRPRSVVIDDEDGAGASKQTSASPSRADGQRKDTPIDVDGSEAKTNDKRRQPIVLDSVEKDDTQTQAASKDSPMSADKVHEIKDDAPPSISKANSVEVADSNDDDDEVTEIKSDLVNTPQPGSASGSSGPSSSSAKKPFRGGAAVNSKKVFVPPGTKKDPKDPRIFTLDSLGSVHTASVDHLKQWMMAEIAERKGVKPLDPGRLGLTAKTIPQQENFCDCGVYLLLYLREFVKDPDSFIEDIVLRQERTWDTSAPDMRKQLRDLILYMQEKYQRDEEEARKKKKKQAGGGGAPTIKRLTPTASLAPATKSASPADVPIPSSEKHSVDKSSSPPSSSSPVSLEAGESSPFLQHGSNSPPNVFDEQQRQHQQHP